MKKSIILTVAAAFVCIALTGCLDLQLGGGGNTSKTQSLTLGQQLIDLQRARDSGAISESEYQVQKAKLLNKN